jgi:hypothetical protein
MFLSLQEKAQYVWNKGMYCYSYWEGKYKINLYWMGNYYAQIWIEDDSNQLRDVVMKDSVYYS